MMSSSSSSTAMASRSATPPLPIEIMQEIIYILVTTSSLPQALNFCLINKFFDREIIRVLSKTLTSRQPPLKIYWQLKENLVLRQVCYEVNDPICGYKTLPNYVIRVADWIERHPNRLLHKSRQQYVDALCRIAASEKRIIRRFSSTFNLNRSEEDLMQAALAAAVALNDMSLITQLLDMGASISRSNNPMIVGSVLTTAARFAHYTTVEYIIQRCVERSSNPYWSGIIFDALRISTIRGHHPVFSCLFRTHRSCYGIQHLEQLVRDAIRGDSTDVILDLIEAFPPAEKRDWRQKTLQLAAAFGSCGIITTILYQYGASPNYGSPRTEAPLVVAANAGQLHAVRILLAHGAAADYRYYSRTGTAIEQAAQSGRDDIVEVLLDAGATMENEKISAFFAAACKSQIGIMRLLIARGANIDKHGCGRRSLAHAVRLGIEPMVRALVTEFKVNPGRVSDDEDDDELSAMEVAVGYNQKVIVETLVDLGMKRIEAEETADTPTMEEL